ncbi:glycine-rich domain-containing protein-like [Moraxella nasovis]|uniref:glycine-rich domain-containing protein n=1 Tax=Moraxella nasovis TaxID=2904121 RepID=UPI001F60638B|nr:glycine-rich domain-containing protein-like [Moraxella nasovis]UNU72537.1 glycine-rich domain-containing protein-like [Moraxella nasovis]
MVIDASIQDYIECLDFYWIKKKLLSLSADGDSKNWTLEGVEDAIRQYKNFMILMKIYDGTSEKIVPSVEVDVIWHNHILDTKAYFKDCEVIYGRYMHHFPYFGIRSKEDYQDLNQSFDRTQELYFQHFGEYMYEIDF